MSAKKCPVRVPGGLPFSQRECGETATIEVGLPMVDGRRLWIGPWCAAHARWVAQATGQTITRPTLR